MDPNANYAEQIRLASHIADSADENGDLQVDQTANAQRLAELVLALHQWVSGGGFPPNKFKR